MESGLYTFLVDVRATKKEIAKTVEKQFSVNVLSVNVLSKAAKTKRIFKTRKTTQLAGGKKAIVALAKGQNIALFLSKKESKSSAREPKTTESEKEKKSKGLLSRITAREEKDDKLKESKDAS